MYDFFTFRHPIMKIDIGPKTLSTADGLSSAHKPSTSLVQLYSQCSLSYEKDALEAFAGLMSSLTAKFKIHFIYGLPEQFFDLALLWRSTKQQATKRRGISDHVTVVTKDLSRMAPPWPSWAWAAWTGPCDYWANRHQTSSCVDAFYL
jgi:hypothetical protein